MRDGPHGLDRGWTKISAFLQDERTAHEKSDEKKTTSHSAEFVGFHVIIFQPVRPLGYWGLPAFASLSMAVDPFDVLGQ